MPSRDFMPTPDPLSSGGFQSRLRVTATPALLPTWLRAVLLVAATVILCSCRNPEAGTRQTVHPGAGSRQAASNDPFRDRDRDAAYALMKPSHRRPGIGSEADHAAALAHVNEWQTQPASPASPILLASAEAPAPSGAAATQRVPGVPLEMPAPSVEMLPDHTVFHDRMEVANAATGCWCPGCAPGQYKLPPSDEVLCDGGDDGLPAVVIRDGTVAGVELEDTVAHYKTQDGQTVIQPTNEVCLYAPRFGSVRQVSGASMNVTRRDVQGLATDLAPSGAEVQREVSTALQNVQPLARASDRPPSLLRNRQQGGGLENEQGISWATAREAALANLQSVRFVLIDNREQPLEVGGMVNAIHWTHDLGVQIAIGTQKAQVVAGDRQAALLYRFEESPEPRLAVCKLADRASAHPGDVVRFALQYANVGNRPISELTIIDNLTTRLEYVEGSQVSDRPADFSAEINEGGSLILRWALPQPLQPGERGLIHFDCRVR
jgi:uncharacterized repeat protein (TIGR01451 family)